MSIGIFAQMVRSEEEICWQRLEIATKSTAGKIETRITDNMNFLMTLADTHPLTHDITDFNAVGECLNSAVEMTIFDRIDVILPDESLITQSGAPAQRGGEASFAQLVEQGTHITQRRTSSFTGKEVICCVTPIERDGDTLGLLVGTIECSTLSELFEVFTYGEAAQLYLIDRADGCFLMDNWHNALGNVQDLGLRQSADGTQMVDVVSTILNGEEARLSFLSQRNGVRSYQYCAPVSGYHWTVSVIVQEDVVFANLIGLKERLLDTAQVGILMVVFFVIWNVFLNLIAARSEQKVKQLEYEHAKSAARANFISNMSHDIRTPLNGIVGMLQIIRNHRDEEATVNDCLEKIEISAQYLSTLTSDILDIREIEHDRLVLPQEPMNLLRLAQEVTTLVEKQASDAGVRYELDVSELEHPRVLGSSVHTKRVLMNLISNAIKYSREAGKHVWVTIRDDPIEPENRHRIYHFIIRDNGIGMSDTFQKSMYQPFEQEANDARSEYRGYGLGLTIVSQLVQKMGGAIELESAKGVGSTFTVSIPFLLDHSFTQPTPEAAAGANLQGMCLLLAEDNALNMEIAHTLLGDAGAVIHRAENGRIALETFAASAAYTYDAILMDMMMPQMDGCEATAAIRRLERPDAATVPIIAMTANTFPEDVQRCIDSGMNAHVAKPLELSHLLQTLLSFRKQ